MARIQALAATGNYALAQNECTWLVRSLGLGDQREDPHFRRLLSYVVGEAMLANLHVTRQKWCEEVELPADWPYEAHEGVPYRLFRSPVVAPQTPNPKGRA